MGNNLLGTLLKNIKHIGFVILLLSSWAVLAGNSTNDVKSEQYSLTLNKAFSAYYKTEGKKSLFLFEKYKESVKVSEVANRFMAYIYLSNMHPPFVESKLALTKKVYLNKALVLLHENFLQDSPNITSLILFAELSRMSKHDDDAIASYKKVLAIEHYNQSAIASLATVYEIKKERQKYVNMYKRLILAVKYNGGQRIDLFYQAYASLGNYYYQVGQYHKAIHYYVKLAKLNPLNMRIQLILGELYKITGRFEKAIKKFNLLIESQPDYLAAYESAIECHYILRDKKTKQLLNRYYEKTKKQNKLIEAMKAELNGSDDEAFRLFKFVLKKNKNRLSVHIGLMKLYLREVSRSNYNLKKEAFSIVVLAQRIGAFRLASQYITDVLHYEELLATEKNFTNFMTSQTLALLENEILFDIALDYAEIYSTHAATQEGLGLNKIAIVYYRRALEYINRVINLYTLQIEDLSKSQTEVMTKEISKLQKKRKNVFSKRYMVSLNLGWLLQMETLQRSKEAEKLQHIIIENNAELPQAHFLLGLIYYNMADRHKQDKVYFIKAQEQFQVSIDKFTQKKKSAPASYYFYLGMTQEKQNRFSNAERSLHKAIKAEPNNSSYLNFLGYMYSIRGIKLDKAGELLLRALEDEPENEAYLDSLGWILYKEKKYRLALQQLLRASNEAEKKKKLDSVIYFHLAETYYNLQDFSLAHFFYTKTAKHIDKASEPLDMKYINAKIAEIDLQKHEKNKQ